MPSPLPTLPSTDRWARRAGLALALAGLAAAACARLGGVRPRFAPIPGSISVQLEAQPDEVIGAAGRELQAAGLSVAVADAPEGYLESSWYDVERKATVSPRARDLAQVVKLRFFADPTAGHTRLAAECVRRIAYDPSEPERDLERMVPDSSPGRALLDSIVGRLKAAYPVVMPAPATPAAPKPSAPPRSGSSGPPRTF